MIIRRFPKKESALQPITEAVLKAVFQTACRLWFDVLSNLHLPFPVNRIQSISGRCKMTNLRLREGMIPVLCRVRCRLWKVQWQLNSWIYWRRADMGDKE